MTFYIVFGIILIALAILAVWKTKLSVFIFLALLPFAPFLKTFIGSLFDLSIYQVNIISLWKEWLILVLLGVVVYRIIDTGKLPFKLKMVDYFILGLLVLAIISFIFTGLNWITLFLGIKYSILLLILYLVIKSLKFSSQDLKISLAILISSSIALGVIVIIQIFCPTCFLDLGYQEASHWSPTSSLQAWQTAGEQSRIPGTLSGPNQLGSYACFVFLLLITILGGYKKRKLLPYLVAVAFLTFPIIFSFSRSAWLSLIVGLIALFSIIIVNKFKVQKYLGYILLALFLIVFISSYWSLSSVKVKDSDIIQRHTDRDRWQRVEQSTQLLLDNPFGLGIGKAGPASQWANGKQSLISENMFLQIGLELGIIGLIGYLLVFIYLLKDLWDRIKGNLISLDNRFGLGLMVSVFALLIGSLYLHVLTDTSLCYSLAILLGIFYSVNNQNVKAEK